MSNDLLTLAQAKGAIRMPATDTSRDSDLNDIYIPAVEGPIVDMLGPLITATFSGTFDGGRPSIVLGNTDVSDVTVTVNGDEYDNVIVDESAGIVFRDHHWMRFPYGRQNIVVQWTAGPYADPTELPATIILAARIILAQLWQADQQGQPRANVSTSSGQIVTTKSGFAVPSRAAELLGYVQLPGF